MSEVVTGISVHEVFDEILLSTSEAVIEVSVGLAINEIQSISNVLHEMQLMVRLFM